MFQLDKHVKIWQLLGAVLAVPAGAAGTYEVYHNFASGGVACPELRSSIISTLEKNIPADTKRTLLREDVERFDKHCGEKDPDVRIVFDAAMAPPQAQGGMQNASLATGSGAIFGLSKTGEKRGWVALVRHNTPDKEEEANFDENGVPVSTKSIPGKGDLITARHLTPVWLEPLSNNDPALLQGRLASGACARVLAIRPATPRLWAEVAPEACK